MDGPPGGPEVPPGRRSAHLGWTVRDGGSFTPLSFPRPPASGPSPAASTTRREAIALGNVSALGRPEGPAGRPINVNTATMAELEALPGIGPVLARRIIEGRPYASVDDLDRVKGIGPKRLEEIRPLVTTE